MISRPERGLSTSSGPHPTSRTRRGRRFPAWSWRVGAQAWAVSAPVQLPASSIGLCARRHPSARLRSVESEVGKELGELSARLERSIYPTARAAMLNKLAVAILPLASGFWGCAGPGLETAPAVAAYGLSDGASAERAGSDDDVVCTTEKPTGSNIPKKICRSRARIERERAEAEEFAERINAPRPTPR